jgi:hypothetical protein
MLLLIGTLRGVNIRDSEQTLIWCLRQLIFDIASTVGNAGWFFWLIAQKAG